MVVVNRIRASEGIPRVGECVPLSVGVLCRWNSSQDFEVGRLCGIIGSLYEGVRRLCAGKEAGTIEVRLMRFFCLFVCF